MNIQDIISSGVIESYVLGAASPEETAMLECMQKSFPEVHQAITEARESLELMTQRLAVTPSADLKERIWAHLETTATAQDADPVATVPAAVPDRKRNKTLHPGWLAAASILLILSLAGNIFQVADGGRNAKQIGQLTAEINRQEQQIALAENHMEMLRTPGMKIVRLKGVEQHPDARAMVFWDEGTRKVYLDAATLPRAPEGKQYQLWAMVDGKPVDAGLYTSGQDIKTVVSVIARAEAFAITLEDKGGSAVPTLANLYVMGTI